LRGLGQLAQKAKPNDGQRKQILTALSASLDGENAMTQFAVLGVLRELGPQASSLLSAVEKLSRDGSSERIREQAKQTAERIRVKDKAATAPTSAEVKQLREEVDRLKKEQTQLRERLRKLELGKAK
jgi:ubiquinone biosynthesis protein UbiJ